MNHALQEKRRFGRVPVQHIVSFAELSHGLPKEPVTGLGRTLDVGAGGALVETDQPLEIGEQIQLEIALGSQIVQADATVVHVMPAEQNMVAAGVSFDRMPAQHRETLMALGF